MLISNRDRAYLAFEGGSSMSVWLNDELFLTQYLEEGTKFSREEFLNSF